MTTFVWLVLEWAWATAMLVVGPDLQDMWAILLFPLHRSALRFVQRRILTIIPLYHVYVLQNT